MSSLTNGTACSNVRQGNTKFNWRFQIMVHRRIQINFPQSCILLSRSLLDCITLHFQDLWILNICKNWGRKSRILDLIKQKENTQSLARTQTAISATADSRRLKIKIPKKYLASPSPGRWLIECLVPSHYLSKSLKSSTRRRLPRRVPFPKSSSYQL